MFKNSFWALMALAFLCSFGSTAKSFAATAPAAAPATVRPATTQPPTPVAATPRVTNEEVNTCKIAALAAAPFTGTALEREQQARHLAIGTPKVLINGVWTSLAAGQHIWGQCRASLEAAKVPAAATLSARPAPATVRPVASAPATKAAPAARPAVKAAPAARAPAVVKAAPAKAATSSIWSLWPYGLALIGVVFIFVGLTTNWFGLRRRPRSTGITGSSLS